MMVIEDLEPSGRSSHEQLDSQRGKASTTASTSLTLEKSSHLTLCETYQMRP